MWLRFWLLLLSLIGVARYLPIPAKQGTSKKLNYDWVKEYHDKPAVIGMGPHIKQSWLNKKFGNCVGSYELHTSYEGGTCRDTLKSKDEPIATAIRCQVMCMHEKSCLSWTYGENVFCCFNTKLTRKLKQNNKYVSGVRNACPPGYSPSRVIRQQSQTQPDQPVQSVQPVQLVQPVQPVQPIQPARENENDANYDKPENEHDVSGDTYDYGHKVWEDQWFGKVAIQPGEEGYRGGCTGLDWLHAPDPFCAKECNTRTADRCNNCLCRCTSGPEVSFKVSSGDCGPQQASDQADQPGQLAPSVSAATEVTSVPTMTNASVPTAALTPASPIITEATEVTSVPTITNASVPAATFTSASPKKAEGSEVVEAVSDIKNTMDKVVFDLQSKLNINTEDEDDEKLVNGNNDETDDADAKALDVLHTATKVTDYLKKECYSKSDTCDVKVIKDFEKQLRETADDAIKMGSISQSILEDIKKESKQISEISPQIIQTHEAKTPKTTTHREVILMAGGSTSTRSVEILDPEGSCQIELEDLPDDRVSHSINYLNSGEVLICGGIWKGKTTDNCLVLDEQTKRFKQHSHLPIPEIRPSGLVLDQTLWLIQSQSPKNRKTMLKLEGKKWKIEHEELKDPNYYNCAVAVNETTFIVIGEFGGNEPVRSFSTETRLWRTLTPLNTKSKGLHLLSCIFIPPANGYPMGRVMVQGGIASGIISDYTAIYDVTANMWKQFGEQNKVFLGNLFLVNGRILLVGGKKDHKNSDTVDEFHLGNYTWTSTGMRLNKVGGGDTGGTVIPRDKVCPDT